jgi:histidine triad (HIT) family protein
VALQPALTDGCAFCAIVAEGEGGHVVLDEDSVAAFLDLRPVFPGHCLVVPKAHHETLADLPDELMLPLLKAVQRVGVAVERAMESDGNFVGVNNRVSQSVPHLHFHVVPRRFKDGLRGFFWPRQRYASDEAMAATADSIRGALELD